MESPSEKVKTDDYLIGLKTLGENNQMAMIKGMDQIEVKYRPKWCQWKVGWAQKQLGKIWGQMAKRQQDKRNWMT